MTKKQTIPKPKPKRKNQKPLSLYGVAEVDLLNDILKAPAKPSEKKEKKKEN
jgi:hypothetical protein